MEKLIREEYLSGNYFRYKDLCKHLNVSWPTVKKYTTDLPDLREVYISTTGKKIRDEYTHKEFISKRELSLKYEISANFVSKILEHYKVAIKSRKVSNRKCLLNVNSFDIITKSSAYWLGFIWGDGSVNDRSLRVKLSIKDLKHLEKLKSFLESTHSIQIYDGAACLEISNSKLVDKLNEYGIIPNKTYNSDFKLTLLSKETIPHFWRGFFDADGCIYTSETQSNYFQLTSYRKNIITKFQSWVSDFNIHRPVNKLNGSYEIRIFKETDIRKIIKELKFLEESNTSLKRKYLKIKEAGLL